MNYDGYPTAKDYKKKHSIDLNTGDLITVVLNDGQSYRGIVIESYPSKSDLFQGSFVARVIETIGVQSEKLSKAKWERFGVQERSCRFELMEDCESVIKESSPTAIDREALGVTYFRTTVTAPKDYVVTFCSTKEGYGGWSFKQEEKEALKESYLSTISTASAAKQKEAVELYEALEYYK